MKEFLIFFIIFLIVFLPLVVIFNGRYIYSQAKHSFIGVPPTLKDVANFSFPVIKDREQITPDRIIVPVMGVDAPVVLSTTDNEAVLQKLLESGVVYYPGSSFINENGTAVIVGHSSAYPWYKGQYGSIFALLNKLNPGDEIILLSKDKKYTYRVTEKQIKTPKDLVFEKDKNNAILYLVSCWPINTAWKRIVVKAVQAIDNN